MKRQIKNLFSALAIGLLLSCSSAALVRPTGDLDSPNGRFAQGKSSRPLLRALSEQSPPIAEENAVFARNHALQFQDWTDEMVGRAAGLIKANQEEGAVLDQRWYGLKYFGKHQELILGADKIGFFGGLEHDVRRYLADQYTSLDPVEDNQDSGDIRLFTAKRPGGKYELIFIGQNGKEVALKTVIRMIYLTKFIDEKTEQKYRVKLASFKNSIRVLMSPVTARQEFIGFFNKHGISNPDAVLIGFRADVRSLMKDDGISDPKSYTDESLRVNWYPDANGKKVLLVSIDQERIFASRSGELIEALFAISGSTPPSLVFLSGAGAIDAPEMVGKIVTPVGVLNGDSFSAPRDKGVLTHLIRNRAADEAAIKTRDITVESVVVETTKWASTMKAHRIDTVDQELFHIMNAINSSTYAAKVDFFAGHLVTDNVSSNADDTSMTLEHAEEVISATSDIRRKFFSKVLKTLGILKTESKGMPRRSRY